MKTTTQSSVSSAHAMTTLEGGSSGFGRHLLHIKSEVTLPSELHYAALIDGLPSICLRLDGEIHTALEEFYDRGELECKVFAAAGNPDICGVRFEVPFPQDANIGSVLEILSNAVEQALRPLVKEQDDAM